MLIPDVVGFKLKGRLPEGATATDPRSDRHGDASQEGRRRKICRILRQRTFEPQRSRPRDHCEYGPEYGATMAFFPVDAKRSHICTSPRVRTKQNRARRSVLQGATLFPHGLDARPALFRHFGNSTSARSNRRWPARSVRKTACHSPKQSVFHESHGRSAGQTRAGEEQRRFVRSFKRRRRNRSNHELHEHFEPFANARAGLLAKKAVERGLQVKPWVKTSLAPGSKVVTDYLAASGLNIYLDKLKFNLVGYGARHASATVARYRRHRRGHQGK